MQRNKYQTFQPTRREIIGVATVALGLPCMAAIDSDISGVQIGAQSYSFRDRSLDDMVSAMVEIGLGECELWQGHLEPRSKSPGGRDELRKWRTTVPLEFFKA